MHQQVLYGTRELHNGSELQNKCFCKNARAIFKYSVPRSLESSSQRLFSWYSGCAWEKNRGMGSIEYQALLIAFTRASFLHYLHAQVTWNWNSKASFAESSFKISNLVFSRKRRAVLLQINDKIDLPPVSSYIDFVASWVRSSGCKSSMQFVKTFRVVVGIEHYGMFTVQPIRVHPWYPFKHALYTKLKFQRILLKVVLSKCHWSFLCCPGL